MLELWTRWTDAFNAASETDEWGRLRALMADDATYTVSGVPFACHLQGADAVLEGFRRSVANFDRAFDQRWWFGVGVRAYEPDVVAARAMGVYRMGDKPLLHLSAPSLWRFRDGKIAAMQDCYDVAEEDVQRALAWLDEHAPDLDPSYA